LSPDNLQKGTGGRLKMGQVAEQNPKRR